MGKYKIQNTKGAISSARTHSATKKPDRVHERFECRKCRLRCETNNDLTSHNWKEHLKLKCKKCDFCLWG